MSGNWGLCSVTVSETVLWNREPLELLAVLRPTERRKEGDSSRSSEVFFCSCLLSADIIVLSVMSQLQFIKSATKLKDFPEDSQSEILFAGRSNAGKSSLINLLAQSKIAKVSQVPGKTRLLNIFAHKDGYRVIDMPGYGFATRSKGEVVSWKNMIEPYLFQRKNITGMLLVMDIRRDWGDEEQQMLELAQHLRIGFALVLNKMDKLSRGAALSRKAEISQQLKVNDCILISVLKKQGLEELEDVLAKWK